MHKFLIAKYTHFPWLKFKIHSFSSIYWEIPIFCQLLKYTIIMTLIYKIYSYFEAYRINICYFGTRCWNSKSFYCWMSKFIQFYCNQKVKCTFFLVFSCNGIFWNAFFFSALFPKNKIFFTALLWIIGTKNKF